MGEQHGIGPRLQGLFLVVICCAWLAGIYLASFCVQALPAPVLLAGSGGALILALLLWHRSVERSIAFLTFCLLLGAWRYSVASPVQDPHTIARFIGASIKVRGIISEEPRLQGRTRMLVVEVKQVLQGGGTRWSEANGRIEVGMLGVAIEDPYGAAYGDTVEIDGKLQSVPPHSPPDIFANMAFPRIRVLNHGGILLLSYLYHLRIMLANAIERSLPQPEAALLVAILLGLRTPALKPLAQPFNVTGTAHLIVPSGFKVTILAGLLAGGIRYLLQRLQTGKMQPGEAISPVAARSRWQNWLATAPVLLGIAAYTILSGAGAAAIRAGVMGALLVIAPLLKRSYNVYTALAFTALLMSLADPFVLWDVGFQLSFLGTLGIVLLTPYFQRLLHFLERLPFGPILVENIAVTLAAQIATLPIFAITFQQVSFISPIANLLTVPLLAILIFLGLIVCGAGLLFAPLALWCGWAVWPLLWYVTHIITWCSEIPGAYFITSNIDSTIAWFYYAFIGILFYFFIYSKNTTILPGTSLRTRPRAGSAVVPGLSRRSWRFIQAGLALLVVLIIVGNSLLIPPDQPLRAAFLAVGPANQPYQGEAILIRTPENKTILIDGGMDTASLAQMLDSRLSLWKRVLDIVVLTSPQKDHITGLLDVINRYTIHTVVDGGMLHPTATYALWRRTISEHNLHYVAAVAGMAVPLGDVTLQVLWPPSQLHKGTNEVRDNTLVVRLQTPGVRLLLLSSAAYSTYALAGLMAGTDARYLKAEIVQIVGEVDRPFTAGLETLLQKVNPSLLVITPGVLNARQRQLLQKSSVPGSIAPSMPPVPGGANSRWQTIQVAQVGTVEITSNKNGWHIDNSGP
ncbi:MAG: ComEC/Rec2 family competence protein [Ktedonobacteraceae bacterium]|nr:ComEC/Rec2 family competence protein [Ktedonobacteraceae bacterium]